MLKSLYFRPYNSGVQDYYLDSRGIAYRTNNLDPSRQTLLFVHGLSGSCSAWVDYEQHFEHAFNVVTFDLRGHGMSARPKTFAEYSLSNFADDIDALVKHLHLTNITLISHSFGTKVALAYLHLHPHDVKRAIFLAPVYDMGGLWTTQLSHHLWCAIATLSPRGVHHSRIDYHPFVPTGDWSPRRIVADVHNTGVKSYMYCLQQLYNTSDAWWSELIVPTVLIHGQYDSIVPVSHARALAKVVPGAQLIEVPNANHILVLNNMPEMIKLIEEATS